jgi:hypothetical protein
MRRCGRLRGAGEEREVSPRRFERGQQPPVEVEAFDDEGDGFEDGGGAADGRP